MAKKVEKVNENIQKIEAKIEAGERCTPEETTEYLDFVNTKAKGITLSHDIKLLFQQDRLQEAIQLIRNTIPTLVSPDEVSIASEVRNFVDNAVGVFRIDEIYRWMPHQLSRTDKQNISNILGRLVEEEVIERIVKRNGVYRKIDDYLDEMDWVNADETQLDIAYPLGIEELFTTYPKNILIFAGTPDAGKTAFFLDFIKMNMEFHKINYFNSEMSEQELRIRLKLHEDIDIDQWEFGAYSRSSNFSDVIKPDEINIIDYLDLGDDIPRISQHIRDIHECLGSGVCLIGLQKPFGRDLGYGKELGMHIPRLYLAMEYSGSDKMGTAKILKCKNRKSTESVINKILNFKLYGGWKFEAVGVWHYQGDDPTEKKYS